MKYLYLFLLILIGLNTNFSLEKSKEESSLKENVPPYASVITRFGQIIAVGGGAPIHTTPTMWILLEFLLPVNYKPLYIYTQFRSSIPLAYAHIPLNDILPIISLENYRIGFLLGLGGYLGDWRNKEGKGWHLSLNGGFVMEFGVANHKYPIQFEFALDDDEPQKFINVGFDINTRIRYNFKKYIGIVLGLDFGYLKALNSGDPFYLALEQKIVSFDTLSYGFSIGLNF